MNRMRINRCTKQDPVGSKVPEKTEQLFKLRKHIVEKLYAGGWAYEKEAEKHPAYLQAQAYPYEDISAYFAMVDREAEERKSPIRIPSKYEFFGVDRARDDRTDACHFVITAIDGIQGKITLSGPEMKAYHQADHGRRAGDDRVDALRRAVEYVAPPTPCHNHGCDVTDVRDDEDRRISLSDNGQNVWYEFCSPQCRQAYWEMRGRMRRVGEAFEELGRIVSLHKGNAALGSVTLRNGITYETCIDRLGFVLVKDRMHPNGWVRVDKLLSDQQKPPPRSSWTDGLITTDDFTRLMDERDENR